MGGEGRGRPSLLRPRPRPSGPGRVCSRQRRAWPRGPAEESITNFAAEAAPVFSPIIVRRQLRARPPARRAAPARTRSIDTATGRRENSFFSPSSAPGGRGRSSASGRGRRRGCGPVPALTRVWERGFQGI